MSDFRTVTDRIFPEIEKRLLLSPRVIVGIDGRSASGKTTAAKELAEYYGTVPIHTDDFFLPPALRTQERYAEPGGNLHYERFREEVSEKLLNGEESLRYHVFNCADFSCDKLSETVSGRVIVIEGAYAFHPALPDVYGLKIFFDISPEEQKRRILLRNGEEKLRMFEEKWIPLEEKYISAFGIKEKADMVIGS